MRLSELNGKEVINLGDGARLGVIGECEVAFDEESGLVVTLEVPSRGGLFGLWGEGRLASIAWTAIRRIGDEVIIVDLSEAGEWEVDAFSGKRERE